MNWRTSLPLAGIVLVVVALYLSWFSNQRYTAGYQAADSAWQVKWFKHDSESSVTITANTLKDISLFNSVLEAKRDAKQQITAEAQKASTDIKGAVAGDNCADRSIPSDAVKRLREHADRLRTIADSANPG